MAQRSGDAPDLSLLPQPKPVRRSSPSAAEGGMFLREIRLQGASLLTAKEIERVVYPFLGPGRSAEDVESARAAVQKLYHDKGYQTVSVSIPQQKVRRGVVVLQAEETRVGKLRVRGARYHEPEQIRRQATSLAEGAVPNFNAVMDDITALNNTADRRVRPELLPGEEPGTLDVNLVVEDSLPLHGGLELNNRNGPDTEALRLNGSLRYDNLWQMGHSVGGSFQISPQNTSQVQVYSGYYRARVEGLEKLSLTLSGTRQDSNVSTLGGAASVGNGYTFSLSSNYVLPGTQSYYQSVTLGLDYKHANQSIESIGGKVQSPINYIPIQFGYNGGWRGGKSAVDIYGGATVHFRGAGSSGWEEWGANRAGADGNFVVLKADLAYTAQLTEGLESYLRLHGQLADSPLITQEKVAGGGLDSVRGYYEGQVTADQALFGTAELRSDPFPFTFHDMPGGGTVQLYAFVDGGVLNRRNEQPDEKKYEYLASYGVGVRFSVLKYFSGLVNLGVPLIDTPLVKQGSPRVTFIIRGDF